MAYGVAEDPALSVSTHLQQVEYPTTRESIVQAAADGGAPVDIINVLKSLPRDDYRSLEEAMRDLSEASRRFGMGNLPADDAARRDRRNIGRDAVENAPPGRTRHP
jgi:hypothetical protein